MLLTVRWLMGAGWLVLLIAGARAIAHETDAPSPWLQIDGRASIGVEPGTESRVRAEVANPTAEPLDILLVAEAPPGWSFDPPRARLPLQPGERATLDLTLRAPALTNLRPVLTLRTIALRQDAVRDPPVHTAETTIPVRAVLHEASDLAPGALRLGGRAALRVDLVERPQQFTLEAWVRGSAPRGRQGLLCNAHDESGFGIYWSDAGDGSALPTAYVHAGGAYASAGATRPWDFARWTHLAMTYDGRMIRFFVDGRIVQETPAPGPVRHNDLPLLIGADVNTASQAYDHWRGEIDEVRLSRVVRYPSEFVPARRHRVDADTVFLFQFDQEDVPIHRDSTGNTHAWPIGSPRVVGG